MTPLAIIILFIWVVTLTALVWIIVRNVKRRDTKKFPTEFNKMALSVGLNKNDIKELKTLLANSGITRPYLVFLDSNILEQVIKENVQKIESYRLQPEEKEKQLLYLFELKRKIHNHFLDMRMGIRNTHEIEANQLLSLKVSGVGNYYSIVIMNDKNNLICSIPEIQDPLKINWKDKGTEVYFWRYNDAGYIFRTVIENVVYSEKLQALILGHTDKMKRIQRREYPRRKSRLNCKFFKFSISKNDKGKPVVLLGRTHFGVLIDISPGGASIVSDDALRRNNALKIEFIIDEQPLVIYGTVLNVIRKQNMYVMHVKFQRITDSAKNQIYRYVYHYI